MSIVYLSTDTPMRRRWQEDMARRDARAAREMADLAAGRLPRLLRPLLAPLWRPVALAMAAARVDGTRRAGREAEDFAWEAIADELERANLPCLVARNVVLQARQDLRPLELDAAAAGPFGLAVIESKGWRYPCAIDWTDAWLERPRGWELRKSPLLQLDEARGLLVRARKAAGIGVHIPIYCTLVLPCLGPSQVSFLAEPGWPEGWRCGIGLEGARQVGRWLASLPARPGLLAAAARTLEAAMGMAPEALSIY